MSDDPAQFLQMLRARSQHHALPQQMPLASAAADARISVPDDFEIGRALRNSIDEIAGCGAELVRLARTPMSDQLAGLLEDLGKITTRIAVVGQTKAGKSAFINALTGRTQFLPTHVDPWTAVPTKLYFGQRERLRGGARFEFFSDQEWRRLGQTLTGPVIGGDAAGEAEEAAAARMAWRRTLRRLGEHYHQLLGEEHRYATVTPSVLAHYLCAGTAADEQSPTVQSGRYSDITKLAHIYLPAKPFASPTILIDTPGVNDRAVIRITTTQAILEQADVYIVILSASRPLAFNDIVRLRRLPGMQKRGLLVFINRIDELDRELAEIKTAETHLRARLRKELPGASIAVASGSALWANTANGGSEEQLRALARSASFRAVAGGLSSRAGAGAGAAITDDVDALRSLMFQASGFPALGHALSELMLAGFLSSNGTRATRILNMAAEAAVSIARGELDALRRSGEEASPRTAGIDFKLGIARLDKRLESLGEASEKIAALIELSRSRIQAICETQCVYIRTAMQNAVDAFAAKQKKLFLQEREESGNSRWRCDTTVLLKQLQSAFLELFATTIRDIVAVHDECMAAVKGMIEQQHSVPDRLLEVEKALWPKMRGALTAIGGSSEVEIGQPWWLNWWSTAGNADDSALELERRILRASAPVVDRLAALAWSELTAFADHAQATIAEVASSTIGGTSARLNDLREQLLLHSEQERKRRETASTDHARGIEENLAMIAKCEAIMTKLRSIGTVQAG